MPTPWVIELVLVVLVILILPLCSQYFDRRGTEETELRGLGLRRGLSEACWRFSSSDRL